jgi:hypothetical protein
MLYAAKCYWPGVTKTELGLLAVRIDQAGAARNHRGIAYLGSLLFVDDDLVLCLFHAPSRATVMALSELAGIPCERLINSTWIGPTSERTDSHEQAAH